MEANHDRPLLADSCLFPSADRSSRQEASSPELPAEMPQSSRALFSFRLAASRLSSRVVGIGRPLHPDD